MKIKHCIHSEIKSGICRLNVSWSPLARTRKRGPRESLSHFQVPRNMPLSILSTMEAKTGLRRGTRGARRAFVSHCWGEWVYYTREVHNMNSKFTEDKQVAIYGWLSLHITTRCRWSTHHSRGSYYSILCRWRCSHYNYPEAVEAVLSIKDVVTCD